MFLIYFLCSLTIKEIDVSTFSGLVKALAGGVVGVCAFMAISILMIALGVPPMGVVTPILWLMILPISVFYWAVHPNRSVTQLNVGIICGGALFFAWSTLEQIFVSPAGVDIGHSVRMTIVLVGLILVGRVVVNKLVPHFR